MATTAGEAIFVDTNVIVHARNADSPDHATAVVDCRLWSRQEPSFGSAAKC